MFILLFLYIENNLKFGKYFEKAKIYNIQYQTIENKFVF